MTATESRSVLLDNATTRTSCHRPKSTYRRRRSKLTVVHSSFLAILVGLLFLAQVGNAKPATLTEDSLPSEFLFDRGEAPAPVRVLLESRDGESHNRSSTSTHSPSHPGRSHNSLPQPFDTSLGSNFTSPTCPTFFNSFLSNDTFTSCLPFSLLLQTSNSFFTISRTPARLTETLDATCNVDFARCSSVMADLAREIQSSDACGDDLELRNPVVLQAYAGFVAYEPLYHAGCLKNVPQGDYCYASAVTNATSPTSSYIYYLPLGMALPGGTQPTCSACLKNTMAVFAEAATNASQPLSVDYGPAAQQIDMTCGPTFVEAVSTEASSAAAKGPMRTDLSLLSITALTVVVLLMNSVSI